jgi:tripartite-type tricarboxylate transporter receptor subunit TctC
MFSYDQRNIVPVAGASNIVVAIAVPSTLPVNSMAELVALARAEPGKLDVATVPGITDFMFSGFLKKAGITMGRVPYRDITQGLGDLAGGASRSCRPQLRSYNRNCWLPGSRLRSRVRNS